MSAISYMQFLASTLKMQADVQSHIADGDRLFSQYKSAQALMTVGLEHGVSSYMIDLYDVEKTMSKTCTAVEALSAYSIKNTPSEFALESVSETASAVAKKILEWFKKAAEWAKSVCDKIIDLLFSTNKKLQMIDSQLDTLTATLEKRVPGYTKLFDVKAEKFKAEFMTADQLGMGFVVMNEWMPLLLNDKKSMTKDALKGFSGVVSLTMDPSTPHLITDAEITKTFVASSIPLKDTGVTIDRLRQMIKLYDEMTKSYKSRLQTIARRIAYTHSLLSRSRDLPRDLEIKNALGLTEKESVSNDLKIVNVALQAFRTLGNELLTVCRGVVTTMKHIVSKTTSDDEEDLRSQSAKDAGSNHMPTGTSLVPA